MRGNLNLSNPNLREGLPLSSPPPTPWPSGPRRRKQHHPASFSKNNRKNPKKVQKVTKTVKNKVKSGKNSRKTGSKVTKNARIKKRKIKYKKRIRIHQSTQFNPSIICRRIYSIKNSNISYKKNNKKPKKIIKSKYTIKRNAPLTNRIKNTHLVTLYIIICLVLETHSVTQELGNKMITKTSLEIDKTGKSTRTGIGRHKFRRTGVCNPRMGTINQGIKILPKHKRTIKTDRNRVKYVKKSDSVFDYLGCLDSRGIIISGNYEYILVSKIGHIYSQATLRHSKYLNRPENSRNNSNISDSCASSHKGWRMSVWANREVKVQSLALSHHRALALKPDSVSGYLGYLEPHNKGIIRSHKYTLVSKIGRIYSQATGRHSKHLKKSKNSLDNSGNPDSCGTSHRDRCMSVWVDRDVGAHSQAKLNQFKHRDLTLKMGHIVTCEHTQPQSVQIGAWVTVTYLCGLSPDHVKPFLSTFKLACTKNKQHVFTIEKNKLHDLVKNKQHERLISVYPVPAVRTAPTYTWSTSSWSAVWLVGWGELVKAHFQTQVTQAWGPPDLRVLDLDVVDLVGRVGGLGGRKSGQSSRRLMEAESGQRMDGQMADGQTMDRWKQNARTESGAQNGWTESEADLKEVRKNSFCTNSYQLVY